MNEAMFNKYYQHYYVDQRIIQRIARKLAKSDHALYRELIQIGLITLWKLNPKKATKNEDAWIRQAMKFPMVDFLRKECPTKPKIQSLDAKLEAGHQLEKDPDTGLPRLVVRRDLKEFMPKDFLSDYMAVSMEDDDVVDFEGVLDDGDSPEAPEVC